MFGLKSYIKRCVKKAFSEAIHEDVGRYVRGLEAHIEKQEEKLAECEAALEDRSSDFIYEIRVESKISDRSDEPSTRIFNRFSDLSAFVSRIKDFRCPFDRAYDWLYDSNSFDTSDLFKISVYCMSNQTWKYGQFISIEAEVVKAGDGKHTVGVKKLSRIESRYAFNYTTFTDKKTLEEAKRQVDMIYDLINKNAKDLADAFQALYLNNGDGNV
jgi:hypothetical protein